MTEKLDEMPLNSHQIAIIREIRESLKGWPSVVGAYLYGSFLRCEIYQDIDIAVYMSYNPDPYERYKLLNRIGSTIESKIQPRTHIDVRALNQAPVLFVYEVISTGILLFHTNEEKISSFEADILIRYLDMKPWFESLDHQYRESMLA